METVGTCLIRFAVKLVHVVSRFSIVYDKFQQGGDSTGLVFFKRPSTFPLPLKVSLWATDNEP